MDTYRYCCYWPDGTAFPLTDATYLRPVLESGGIIADRYVSPDLVTACLDLIDLANLVERVRPR